MNIGEALLRRYSERTSQINNQTIKIIKTMINKKVIEFCNKCKINYDCAFAYNNYKDAHLMCINAKQIK